MISRFSVKKPYTVLVGVVLAIVLGVVSFTRMTADLLPNISLPYVIVMTTYVGASPETVETVVTKPVEASMATVSNIESINSVSGENYSMVILEFAQTADMDSISLEIRENLDQISGYWQDDLIGSPIIMKLNPDMMPVMIAAAGIEGKDVAEVSRYIEDVIMPELESLEGVASVNATGMIEENVNVIIRQEKIDAVNERIRAAIDSKLDEAGQELADGKAEFYDSMGVAPDDSEGMAERLENAQSRLEAAKKELEALRASASADLTMLEQMTAALAQLESAAAMAQGAAGQIDAMIEGLKAGYAAVEQTALAYGMDEAARQAAIGTFKENTVAQLAAAGLPADTVNAVSVLDWSTQFGTDASAGGATVCGILYAYKASLENLPAQAEELRASIAVKSLCTVYDAQATAAYMESLREQLAAYNSNLTKIEEQLAALSQGEEALVQIEEGEQQLKEAREDAYANADMKDALTMDTVSALLTAQNFSMPAGYVTEEGVSYLVRVGDKPQTAEEMAAMPLLNLHMEGLETITLADVADVFYTDNSDEVYANINGSAGVMLSIQKQTGYSTGEVSDALLLRFEELMEENPDLQMIPLMDQGIYIDLVMDTIVNNVVLGALLAILILILFLKDLRPTLVVAFSIPISLVTAIVCMYFSGVTLNIISLSGLALGIGMLVDNSIVVIENIYRLRGEGRSMREAAIEGAKEVAGAIMASTLTTICVFAPIVFTEGITRQLFVDMGLTIAYSLLASLLIALTVVPAMASKMMTKTKEQKEGKLFGGLVKGYEKLLRLALKGKPVVLLLVVALLAGSALAAVSNGTAFMSDMDSTQLTVSVSLEEGASLQDTAQVTDEVVRRIRELPDVQDVGAMSSASTMTMLTGGQGSGNAASIYVTTVQDKTMTNEELGALIVEHTSDLQAEITVDASSMDMSALGGSGITVRVEGRELDTIQKIAGEIAVLLAEVEGTAEVSDGMEESGEELRVTVDKEAAMEYGLTVAQVFSQISEKLKENGAATTLAEADKDYGVYVIDEENEALTRVLLQSLLLEGTDAEGACEVKLSEIAAFEMRESLTSIQRADQTRYVAVSAQIAEGYNVGQVAAAVEKKLADYTVPDGYRLVFAGENETINDAMEQVMLMLVLALVFMYLIMVAQFQSLLSPFIIMFTIPLAFTGGLLGLFFTGSEVSVIALIGFVMLSGIIVNNGIVLIDYMNQLRESGMEKKEAILTAGRTRLRPVLMTALTTILALSTMVFSRDMGAEMMRPMAIVTIGGLLYGTLLTLIVIPCVYDLFIREKKAR